MTDSYFLKRKNQNFASQGGIKRSDSPLHTWKHSFPYLVLNTVLKFIFYLDARKTPSYIPTSIPPSWCILGSNCFLFHQNLRTSRMVPNNSNCHLLSTQKVAGTRLKWIRSSSQLNFPDTTPKFVLAPI